MAVKIARFLAELRNFGRVVLDTSVLIYHLSDTEPYSELTEAAFGAIAGGSPTAVLSTISITRMAQAVKKPENFAGMHWATRSLDFMGFSCLAGAIVLFPSLFFLFRVFKGKHS